MKPALKEHTAPLILASASARRRELLASAGVRFDVVPSEVDESRLPGEAAVDFVSRIAREKVDAVAKVRRSIGDRRPVLGADTTVVLGQTVLGKPEDAEDARRMLCALSGRTHEVLTGVCLRTTEGVEQQVVTTEVTFITLEATEIERYLERANWHDKAGAYAVQEHAAYMIRNVRGSYTNVVGLPLAETIAWLRRANAAP